MEGLNFTEGNILAKDFNWLEKEKDDVADMTLYKALKSLRVPKRFAQKPLRISVEDIKCIKGGDTCLLGKIESG